MLPACSRFPLEQIRMLLHYRAAAAAQQPIPTAGRRHCHRPTITTSSPLPTTSRTRRWARRLRCSSPLPPLQQRPQYHHPLDDDQGNDEDSDAPRGGGDPPTPLSTPTDVLRLMDCLHLPIEANIYADLLRECTRSMDFSAGAQVHAHICRGGGRRLRGQGVLLVANRLLLMYCSFGQPGSAREIFDRMPVRDSISWATMVAGLSDSGDHRGAVQLFVEMLESGCSGILLQQAGALCIAALLSSCAQAGYSEFGQCVHGLVLKSGVCEGGCRLRRQQLSSSLIQLYSLMGCMGSAKKVFMEYPSSGNMTTMMSIYCRHHMFQEALEFFKVMGGRGKLNNHSVLSTVLKACGQMVGEKGQQHGLQAHAGIVKTGLDSNEMIQVDLLQMYGRLGLTEEARKVFDMISGSRSCWNIMFDTYARSGCRIEAIKLLYEMRLAGVEPREYMINEIKLVCGSNY